MSSRYPHWRRYAAKGKVRNVITGWEALPFSEADTSGNKISLFEAKENNAAVAEYALEQIGLLYAIERKAKGQQLTAEEIFELRQSEALPILETLGKCMKETYVKSLPKSTIGKALGYSIERWQELMMDANDGKIKH